MGRFALCLVAASIVAAGCGDDRCGTALDLRALDGEAPTGTRAWCAGAPNRCPSPVSPNSWRAFVSEDRVCGYSHRLDIQTDGLRYSLVSLRLAFTGDRLRAASGVLITACDSGPCSPVFKSVDAGWLATLARRPDGSMAGRVHVDLAGDSALSQGAIDGVFDSALGWTPECSGRDALAQVEFVEAEAVLPDGELVQCPAAPADAGTTCIAEALAAGHAFSVSWSTSVTGGTPRLDAFVGHAGPTGPSVQSFTMEPGADANGGHAYVRSCTSFTPVEPCPASAADVGACWTCVPDQPATICKDAI